MRRARLGSGYVPGRIIDKIVGSVDRSRANDFSKIQGRFRTRLSLSSVNVEEVIEKRLLAKRPEVRSTLEKEFGDKGDILKNQMSFRDVGMDARII